jgi:hypothetical protein
MQTLVERGCGLDVHQATVVACLLMVRRDESRNKCERSAPLRESWWICANGCSLKAAPMCHGEHGSVLEADGLGRSAPGVVLRGVVIV